MNSILRTVSLSALVLCSPPALADVESWYTYWGIGLADHSYPDELDRAFSEAEAQPGVSRNEMSLDMLGFYWPLANNKTILGFVVSGSFDALDYGYGSSQLNQYLYSVSAMRFAGDEPGEGFFVRGDIGLAKAVFDTAYGETIESDSGYGFLGGAGYGFVISGETRLLLSTTYSSSELEGETYSTLAFNVAGLW